MIKDVGNILKSKIELLPFIDRIAGVVQTAKEQTQNGSGGFKTSRFPVSCNVDGMDCVEQTERLRDLIPNSEKKSIFYFEDINGVQFVSQVRKDFNFIASIRLVGWLNKKKLGKDDCSITSIVVANVIRALTQGKRTFNEFPFTKVSIKINQQVLGDEKIFSRYSYSETEIQYLIYPYDFFALDLKVKFSINEDCMEEFELGIENECNDI